PAAAAIRSRPAETRPPSALTVPVPTHLRPRRTRAFPRRTPVPRRSRAQPAKPAPISVSSTGSAPTAAAPTPSQRRRRDSRLDPEERRNRRRAHNATDSGSPPTVTTAPPRRPGRPYRDRGESSSDSSGADRALERISSVLG